MTDNVINFGKYREEEASDTETLINSVGEMDFDEVLVLGLKDNEVYLAHTPFDSRLKLMGAVSGMEHWLWTKGG